VTLWLPPRGSRPSSRWRWAAGLGWCCPSATWCMVYPWPGPNSIFDPALLGPRLALGHACECPSQSTTWRLDCSQKEASQVPRGV